MMSRRRTYTQASSISCRSPGRGGGRASSAHGMLGGTREEPRATA
uniref:Uncharacterized protein n=1 Tax=Arundo donax TaxID=35708 RepID=A0A0A9AP52_ARUDO